MNALEQNVVTIPVPTQRARTQRAPIQRTPSPRGQRGMSLLEVLIAVLVLAIGLLGIAALQATALRNSQSSMERTQAVIETYAILDAMRANLIGARAGNYELARTCAATTAAGNPADLLRDADHQAWITDLQRLGPGSCGTIACVNTSLAKADCTITVEWNDSRGTGGLAAQQMTTVVQL